MRAVLASTMAASLVLGMAAAGWSQTRETTYDPDLYWGAYHKVFYEPWGFGPAAGNDAKTVRPYLVTSYPRSWTSAGANDQAWVVWGSNNVTAPSPKPGNYAGTAKVRESNDWTNPGSSTDPAIASFAFASRASGSYLEGPQSAETHKQSVWLDANYPSGDSGPRSPIILKHAIPTLPEATKVRADAQYYYIKNADQYMGYGIRMFFDKVGGGLAYADFALHFAKADGLGNNWVSTYGWRVVGIAQHPEWESWTDTGRPALTVDVPAWKQVAIDCGQLTPGGLTFIARLATVPDDGLMVAAALENFTQYITGATDIAVGQVDEAPDTGTANIGDNLWLDNIWISYGDAPVISTIGEAKTAVERVRVDMTGTATCTQTGNQGISDALGFAIEDADRSKGIRVLWPGFSVSPGDHVSIAGWVTTSEGERIINANTVSLNTSGNEYPKALGMNNMASSGGAFGAQGAVVNDANGPTWASGLSSVGLLVKIWGKVTASTVTTTWAAGFYLDDGSGLLDGSGNTGIQCRPMLDPIYLTPLNPELGRYVVVTGAIGVRQVNGKNARYLWTQSWEYAD